MTQNLNVHLLPELACPEKLAGHTTVMIDVLRASTTITTALACGARAVVPCQELDAARQMAEQLPGSLLGGERSGRRPAGFDLGNSPAEYVPPKVRDKTIVFTTGNGTRALARCGDSKQVLIGALVNRSAVCQVLRNCRQVDLLCAGIHGSPALDDTLTAGAIAQMLLADGVDWQLNDAAIMAKGIWIHEVGTAPSSAKISQALAKSQGGRNLRRLGMEVDLPWAAELDRYSLVPELDGKSGQIRPGSR